MEFAIDYSPRTPWCGTCEIAIVSVNFSQDWLTISIKFDFKIEFIDVE